MTQSANITINYDNCSEDAQECGGRLMKISDTEYTPGTVIYFDVWAVISSMLSGLVLWKGNKSMGTGTQSQSSAEITEVISFEGDTKKQLTYPMYGGAFTVSAKTDIMGAKEGTGRRQVFAAKGQILGKSKIKKIGFSCIGTTNNDEIYGSVKVTYQRAMHRRRWSWVVPNESGDFWFFLCEDSKLILSEKCSVEALEGELISEADVTICIKEYTTESVVGGASVYVDGTLRGETDSSGEINLNGLAVGSHSLRIVKSGYVSSDEDDLENDSFVIGNTI